MWIEIEVTGNVFVLEGELGFTSVPDGNQWQVQARYSTTGDEFRVEVQNPDTLAWRSCLGLPTEGSLTEADGCFLALAEYNAGSPTLRIVDLTASTTTDGHLVLDYVRIRIT
jgi:hypothetical protein